MVTAKVHIIKIECYWYVLIQNGVPNGRQKQDFEQKCSQWHLKQLLSELSLSLFENVYKHRDNLKVDTYFDIINQFCFVLFFEKLKIL